MANPIVQGLVVVGAAFALLQIIAILVALRRWPQPPELPLSERLRGSLLASGAAGRRWVTHPWQMTLLYMAVWIGFALAYAARTAVYSR